MTVWGIQLSDAVAGAIIGASAVLLAGIVERRALRVAARRDRLQHAVTRLTTESLVLIADLGVFGTAVFRKSIWYHIIGVPDARRIQRQSMRVIAEARSDLAMVRPKTTILDAADALLEAVSAFVSIVTAEKTSAKHDADQNIERIVSARRTLLDASAKKARWRT